MSFERTSFNQSLRSRFLALERERQETWTEAALEINLNQRATLLREHGSQRHIQIGDTVPATALVRIDGEAVSLESLVAHGPAVIIFFRFAGCPACNIALPYYRDTIWPTLREAGIPLVAISPQPIDALQEIAQRHELPFDILSDTDLALSRALGITYVFDTASREAAEAKGGTSQALNGTGAWELPKPAVLVIDPDRVVHFVDISPDWMDRTEAPAILSSLQLLVPA